MPCNLQLIAEGKPYPRTCEEHGLHVCPPLKSQETFRERYQAAPGWVQRQWIVNEIMQSADGVENEIHRILSGAT